MMLLLYSLLFVVVILFLHIALTPPSPPERSPKEWKAYHWPVLGSALQFYSQRRDMLTAGALSTLSGNFGFHVGKKHIVSLSGISGRKTFYESRKLNFAAGFVELLAGIPSLGEPAKEEIWARHFNRTLLSLMRRETLVAKIPFWKSDVRETCDRLTEQIPGEKSGGWGVLNPFDDLYELVYKLTIRVVGPNEIARDQKLLKWSLSIFERFEKSSSTAGFIFPWLITPSHVARLILGTKLYLGLSKIIAQRKRCHVQENDALQYLMDNKNTTADIIKFQISALWAGVVTTGTMGSWLPLLLSANPPWQESCRQEVHGVINKYRNGTSQAPREVLDTLSIEVWESEFPLLYNCIRETIRLVMPGTVFRKNTSGSDIPIGHTGEIIPNGSFAAYSLDDIHMNPQVYVDPYSFNPGRYFTNADVSTDNHSYVGWGSGRHPCLGAKVARLEITMIMAYLLVSYEFELSNSDATAASEPLKLPDRNGHKAHKEIKPIYMRYRLYKLSGSRDLA